MNEISKELRISRRLLLTAGSIYLFWWFAVEALLKGSFNPFASRIIVVGLILGTLCLSYFSAWIRQHLRLLFYISLWLITFHYFYLFYGNLGDINWVIGAYITVIAVSLGFFSSRSLLAYSIFVTVIASALVYGLAPLRSSVFLPGLVTILIQANIGLQSRLGLIKTLATSNERFRLLFDSTFEGVLVHEQGRILDVNESLAQLLGYKRMELIGKNAFDLLHPTDRDLAIRRMTQNEISPFPAKGLRANGSSVDLELRAKNFVYDQRPARLVTMLDITDRIRAESERVTALTLAENVRVRDEFISIASHELKTPISSLKLQTQLIERDLKKGQTASYTSESFAGFVALFNRQVDRLTELVETMLDVSRISAGRLTLELQTVDIAQVVRESIDHMGKSLQALSSVVVDAPEHLNAYVDQSRIRQVIENLLSNAMKYGAGKPVNVKIRADGPQVLLIFQDQGIGIAPEFIDRIFNRFERAISGRNISGLGLGLYIARQVIEAHHGHISVTSTPGVGSVFTVSLPKSQ